MPRFPLPLILLAAMAVPGAVPAAAVEGTGAGLVRLEAPRAGETLTAGATAELAWAPLAPLGHADEWEAFLSLDGGATWPVRITPHLDRELRRIRWQVPALPTGDARLLLRFGDEQRETAVELPQRFAIAEAPGGAPLFGIAGIASIGVARPAPGRGEPALPGHPGVVAWVEGSRQGGHLRTVVSELPAALTDTARIQAVRAAPAVLTPRPGSNQLTALLISREGEAPSPSRQPLAPAGDASGLPSPDILRLTQRQNE